jgi:hypothetical protein
MVIRRPEHSEWGEQKKSKRRWRGERKKKKKQCAPLRMIVVMTIVVMTEVSHNSIKVGCNTRLKRVRVLPHKTNLNIDFELGFNGLSVYSGF